METETAGWKWVLQVVVESAAWVLALCVLGPLTLSLMAEDRHRRRPGRRSPSFRSTLLQSHGCPNPATCRGPSLARSPTSVTHVLAALGQQMPSSRNHSTRTSPRPLPGRSATGTGSREPGPRACACHGPDALFPSRASSIRKRTAS